MRIGYGRVSTRDQHPEAQHDALTAAGREQVFLDTASGKLTRRPELDKALLSANRTGPGTPWPARSSSTVCERSATAPSSSSATGLQG